MNHLKIREAYRSPPKPPNIKLARSSTFCVCGTQFLRKIRKLKRKEDLPFRICQCYHFIYPLGDKYLITLVAPWNFRPRPFAQRITRPTPCSFPTFRESQIKFNKEEKQRTSYLISECAEYPPRSSPKYLHSRLLRIIGGPLITMGKAPSNSDQKREIKRRSRHGSHRRYSPY